MIKDLVWFLARRSIRQIIVGSLILLYILVLAVIGFIATFEVWYTLGGAALGMAAAVFCIGVWLEARKEGKREEYRAHTSDYLYNFLHDNGALPVPVKIPRSAEEAKQNTEVFIHRLVATATVKLLLRNTAAVRDPENNCSLAREWLIQYAKEYGIRNNQPGYAQFPRFYPVSVTLLDNYLQISLVIVDGWMAANRIKNQPPPQEPDKDDYKDEDFL